jgi:hypothetical protein
VGLGCKIILGGGGVAVKEERLFINLLNGSCIDSSHVPFVMCVHMDVYLRDQLICTDLPTCIAFVIAMTYCSKNRFENSNLSFSS